MPGVVSDPFRTADKIVSEAKEKGIKTIIVDIHAEATSEKAALGFYLDGRVSAVLGTHTHVPTADVKILPKGTAFVTDLGMVGGRDTVLGVDKDIIIKHQMEPIPQRFEWPEKGAAVFNSVLLDIDDKSGKVNNIERLDKEIE